MSQQKTSGKKRARSRWLIGAGVVAVVAVAGALLLPRLFPPPAAAGQTLRTAEVTVISASVTASSAAMAFGFAAAVGVFFGLHPAWRAAQLRPIEALCYE